ncbi:DNA-binding transcriptional regulator, MarR family [Actinomadura meyerae]|jgi:DNA-binding MarR family transcriptional regulator|uniref:DNA-binding transcriptional regulator, MarR family n=1 Tax=Actinomadura meyerae TaxID=240840 RepID=A0A239P7J7_9ACTN|nr:MarR family transcriptional regulator [Actinomadura meyerae]SNT62995.1 DNA-binding transcriptional regulator, MarR family [Actinomadura meyerae]
MARSHGDRIQRAFQVALVNAVLGNDRIAREAGLMVTDTQALHLLMLRDDIRNAKRLSDVTGISTSTVSRIVDRLERAGYLRRVPDPDDRRSARLELDMTKVQPLVDRYAEYVSHLEKVNAGYTDDQLDLIAGYLEKTNNLF